MPVLFPVIEVVPVETPVALTQLPLADWLVFISPSAVRMALAAVGALPQSARLAAVGQGTARALRENGYATVLCPSAGADSEALLALPELQSLAGRRVILFRGEGGRDLLAATLAARGAEVIDAVCYRRVVSVCDAAPVQAMLRAGQIDAVSVTSREILDALLAKLGEDAARLVTLPLFAPHPRIVQAARDRGMLHIIEIASGDAALLTALQQL